MSRYSIPPRGTQVGPGVTIYLDKGKRGFIEDATKAFVSAASIRGRKHAVGGGNRAILAKNKRRFPWLEPTKEEPHTQKKNNK